MRSKGSVTNKNYKSNGGALQIGDIRTKLKNMLKTSKKIHPLPRERSPKKVSPKNVEGLYTGHPLTSVLVVQPDGDIVIGERFCGLPGKDIARYIPIDKPRIEPDIKTAYMQFAGLKTLHDLDVRMCIPMKVLNPNSHKGDYYEYIHIFSNKSAIRGPPMYATANGKPVLKVDDEYYVLDNETKNTYGECVYVDYSRSQVPKICIGTKHYQLPISRYAYIYSDKAFSSVHLKVNESTGISCKTSSGGGHRKRYVILLGRKRIVRTIQNTDYVVVKGELVKLSKAKQQHDKTARRQSCSKAKKPVRSTSKKPIPAKRPSKSARRLNKNNKQ